MHYQLRWLYLGMISLILLAMSYMYDIQPVLKQLAELNHAEKKLIKKLHIAQSFNAKFKKIKNVTPLPVKNELDRTQDLIAYMHANDLMIRTIRFSTLRETSQSERALHFVVEGNLQQWYSFITSLEKLDHLIRIRDFSCKVNEKNNLVFTMDILLSRNHIYPLNKQPQKINALHHTFCPPEGLTYSLNQTGTASVPIRQIKMMGYLHNYQHSQALLLLPNRMMLSVAQGERLGKERAVITDIHKDRINVKLPDGTSVVLMSS